MIAGTIFFWGAASIFGVNYAGLAFLNYMMNDLFSVFLNMLP